MPLAAQPTASVPEVGYPAGAVTRVVGQAGDIRWHRSRVLIGAGLVGQPVEVRDQGHQIEVYYSTYRTRCVATDLLVPHKMV